MAGIAHRITQRSVSAVHTITITRNIDRFDEKVISSPARVSLTAELHLAI
jgi:hypothetical protein